MAQNKPCTIKLRPKMRPPTSPQGDYTPKHEEDASDEPLEGMPVNRIASFSGKLDLHQFTHSAGGTMEPKISPNYSPPVQAQAKVRRNSRRNELAGDAMDDLTPSSALQRSLRPRTKRTTSTSSASTELTPSPTRRPPMTRSQTSSSLSPPMKNKINSTKALGRAQRQRSQPTHLPEEECVLKDTIPKNLILLLVGVNPGIKTGQTGFAYAHPTNQFWKLLHASGITDKLHPPSDTYILPELYGVGNTNIVARATVNASMLSKAEMDAGVPMLDHKVAEQRPEAVCLVGKGIWEAVYRVKMEAPFKQSEFQYGWQDEFRLGVRRGSDYPGARIFVTTTTSGLSTNFTFAERVGIWKELGDFVRLRRVERGHVFLSSNSA